MQLIVVRTTSHHKQSAGALTTQKYLRGSTSCQVVAYPPDSIKNLEGITEAEGSQLANRHLQKGMFVKL